MERIGQDQIGMFHIAQPFARTGIFHEEALGRGFRPLMPKPMTPATTGSSTTDCGW